MKTETKMKTIYFDNGCTAFKATETNCILVNYNKYVNICIQEQPDNKEHYIKEYGGTRIDKTEFDTKFEQAFNHLISQ